MPDDLLLIERWSRFGDAEAFTELAHRHAGMVYGTCRRIVRDHHIAEDLAQECLLALARKAGTVRSSVAAFLHTTAVSRSRNRLRQDQARRHREELAAVDPVVAVGDREPSWAELAPLIDAALAEQSEELRAPLVLHFLEGRSQVAVAEELGCDQATVSRRIAKGLETLRGRLGKAGLGATVLALSTALTANAVEAAPPALTAAAGKMAMAGADGLSTAAAAAAGKPWLTIVGAAAVACALVAGALLAEGHRAAPAARAPATPAIPSPAWPLRPSADRHHLVDQVGRPFLWIGDSASAAIANLAPADMDQYLDDRKARGFTLVNTALIEHKFSADPPNNAAGQPPFTGKLSTWAHDFTTPNEAYFRTADLFVSKAAARGLCVLLSHSCLGYEGGDEGWFNEMKANGPERLRAWGRWLGKRYRDAANLIWLNGRDFTPPPADRWVVEEVAQGIRDAGAAQLMTIHLRRGEDPAATFGERNWFDLDNVFAGSTGANRNPRPLQQLFHDPYARTPTRPVVLIQAMHELVPGVTPELLRSQAYLPFLTGGCGVDFGNLRIDWFAAADGSAPAWRQLLDGPGSRDVQRLASVLRGHEWWKLEPDTGHTTLTGGFRAGDAEIAAARAMDGSLVLAYAPSTGTGAVSFTIALDRLAGAVDARWFNPARGGYVTISGSPFANRGNHTFTTPGDNGSAANDWLLVLTAASASR